VSLMSLSGREAVLGVIADFWVIVLAKVTKRFSS
jgi:hypothetical protein